MVEAQFSRIYQRAGVELGVFCDEDDAMVWLAERGFKSS
jgi:hypothetical protein